MIHFVVVSGVPAAVARLAALLPHALHATRYFGGGVVEHRATSGAWALAAISHADPICPERIAVTDEAVAIVNGPVLSKGGDARSVAEDVLRACTTTGGPTTALSGGY